jgi:hypothetical protein
VDSSKNALSSSTPSSQATPVVVVPGGTDHITQEAYVTDTALQSAHGAEPVVAATTTKSSKGGPINAIRNFFSRIFNSSQRHEDRQKSATATVETTETITTTTTVATSNPPNLS